MSAQFVLACVTAALHVVCAATTLDGHYSVSVSYLCAVSGSLLAAGFRPLDSTSNLLVLALLCVAELAALGMTFASTQGSTALFLHYRGVWMLLVPVTLEHLQCNGFQWGFLRPQDVGLFLALSLMSTQLAPFDTVSCVAGGLTGGALAGLLMSAGKSAAAYVAMGVAALLLLSSVAVWVPVWFPKLPEMLVPNLSVPVFTSFGLPVLRMGSLSIEAGPLLLTLVLGTFWILGAYVGISQVAAGNYMQACVVGVPVVLILVWVLLLWLLRDAPPPDAPADSAPSAPPLTASRRLAWPRVKVALKEHVP